MTKSHFKATYCLTSSTSFRWSSWRFQAGTDCCRFSSSSRWRCSSASFLAFSAAFRASICRFQSGITAPVTSLSGTFDYIYIVWVMTDKTRVDLFQSNLLQKFVQRELFPQLFGLSFFLFDFLLGAFHSELFYINDRYIFDSFKLGNQFLNRNCLC